MHYSCYMNLSYRIAWIIFRAIFATYFRWRAFGAENVPYALRDGVSARLAGPQPAETAKQ